MTPTGNKDVFQLQMGIQVGIPLCVLVGQFTPRWAVQVAWFLGPQWGLFQAIDRKPGDAAGARVTAMRHARKVVQCPWALCVMVPAQ